MKMETKVTTILLALIGLSGVLSAETLDAAQFQARARLAVKGYTGASTLADFPVLVRLAKDRPLGFTYAAAGEDGAGLRFSDAEGNLIPHEVDTWNTNGTSFVWVKLPMLPANGTIFWVNWSPVAEATLPEVTASDVWSKYVAVMHGNEFADSSPSQLTVANGGAVTAGSTDALVGKSYNKTNNNAVGLNFTNPWTAGKFTTNGKMTVSGWMKFVNSGYTHVWFSSVSSFGAKGSISYWELSKNLQVNTSGTIAGYLFSALPYNVWNHVAIAYDSTSMNLYYNGDCRKSATVNALGDTSQANWTFGSYAGRASVDSFKGVMDELRIYDGTASADWIKAEYDSAHNANFVEELIDETKFTHCATLAVPGYQGASALEDFPVLVRLQANFPMNFAYADAGTNGANLRFADGEGHPLAFEIDTWNASGESLVWVRLPSLSSSLATFKMYWGASDLDGLPMPVPRSTWTKYVAVMHGNEFADASPNRLTVANGGAVTAGSSDAVMGKSYNKTARSAVGLNFTNPWTAGKFTTNGKMTVSGWMKYPDTGYTHVWFSSVSTYGAKGVISYWERGSRRLQVNTSGSVAGYLFSAFPYNAWSHLAIAYNNKTMSLYHNGVCLVTSTGNALDDTNQPNWTFGSYAGNASADSLQGVMDELRIYDGTASADWIKAEYDVAHSQGYVTEISDTTPVTAIWKGTGAAGVMTDPANWECRNAEGEVIAAALPRADITTILIQDNTPEFSVTDVANCCGRRYQVENATLAGDCEWTGLADRLEFVGTLNLNGHTLTVADLPGAGTITGSGTLRVTTAGTATIGTALTGALSLVKAGTGTLVASRAGQSYTGGTTVEAGILRFATASTPAGALTGKITVKNGGAVDLYANAGCTYPYDLEGNGPAGRGVLFTSLDQNSWYTTWMGDVALTGDASFGSGIVCNGRTLTLNQHVLSLNADHTYKVANSKEVLFQNARVADEGVIRVPAGRLSSLANGSSAANTTFTGDKVTLEFVGTGDMVGLLIRGGFKVKNLSYSSSWAGQWVGSSDVAPKVVVDGCYSPNSTNLPPVMLTGPDAVLDLSAKTETFAAATGFGLSFADNAVVTLALGERETVNDEQLVSWTKPANLDTLTFKLEKALRDEQYHLRVKDDGIFIYRSGLIIMVR